MGLSLLGVRFTASTDLEKWSFKVNKKGDNIRQNECLNNLSYSIKYATFTVKYQYAHLYKRLFFLVWVEGRLIHGTLR